MGVRADSLVIDILSWTCVHPSHCQYVIGLEVDKLFADRFGFNIARIGGRNIAYTVFTIATNYPNMAHCSEPR